LCCLDNIDKINDTALYNKPFHSDHSSNELLVKNGFEVDEVPGNIVKPPVS
jgi:hypothetical protein